MRKHSFSLFSTMLITITLHPIDARVLVPQPKSLPNSSEFGKFGVMQIQMYEKKYKAGLSPITVEDITSQNLKPDSDVTGRRLDVPWMARLCCRVQPHVGWNGYMEMAMECNNFFETSGILAMSIVDLDPSNP
ncbi:hypothetical protein PR048_003846 [Dryococelus australis]|uniref:Uncharacterized protein n=1 Tax=Dryococelus australis TaxID=614101 RepID=A0ABQ9IP54_9NEOP|nr:hypothetical protein PR048_003846 [Dryococelus australis]